ncbi:MAG: hypothetical protein ACREFE_02025 [Limisphaerales bacterium]
MKTFVAIFCALFAVNQLITGGLLAQSTAQGDQTQSSGSSAPNNSSSQPVPGSPLDVTKQNIANLRADFEALKTSPTNMQPLINDLTVAAEGTKPQQASISKLAADLTTAIGGNAKLQTQKLAQDVHAIFNSSHLSSEQQEMVFEDVQNLLTNSGTLPADAKTVVNDIKTIATETK